MMKISFLAVVIVPVASIIIFTSYSFYTQVMLILILVVVQSLQNVVFSFEKGLNGQNHSSSGFHHPIKKSTLNKIPSPLNAIWKTLAFFWYLVMFKRKLKLNRCHSILALFVFVIIIL